MGWPINYLFNSWSRIPAQIGQVVIFHRYWFLPVWPYRTPVRQNPSKTWSSQCHAARYYWEYAHVARYHWEGTHVARYYPKRNNFRAYKPQKQPTKTATRNAFTHERFYPRKLLPTKAFTHESLYPRKSFSRRFLRSG